MNRPTAPLGTIAREWLRIGLIGFGGPPAHITLLARAGRPEERLDGRPRLRGRERRLLAAPRALLDSALDLLRLPGRRAGGAVIGGLGFVVPAVVMVIALSVLFLSSSPPLLGPRRGGRGWRRGGGGRGPRGKRAGGAELPPRDGGPWPSAALADLSARRGAAAILIGPYLVLVLVACGLLEMIGAAGSPVAQPSSGGPRPLAAAASTGGIGALAWTALKVGALSFGGGFVIIPLMQDDAVNVYHWMSGRAVPERGRARAGHSGPGGGHRGGGRLCGPRHGGRAARGRGRLRTLVLVHPARRRAFERLRGNDRARGFLDGAGPAAIGAILGSAVTLAEARRGLAVPCPGGRRDPPAGRPPRGGRDSARRRGGRRDLALAGRRCPRRGRAPAGLK